MAVTKVLRRKKIKARIRSVISGTSNSPRLSVFRSNKQIYAQLIDDTSSVTLVSISSRDPEVKGSDKSEVAKSVGQLIAKKAKDLNIDAVVFDRSGYLYHGRVKSLAEGAREGGLQF